MDSNQKKVGDHPYPPHYDKFGGTRRVNSKIVVGFEILHGLLSNKNIRIPTQQKKLGTPLPLALCYIWADKGVFSKVVVGFQTSDRTSEGLGNMFEGDSADTCARKFPLMSMGGQANGQACAYGEGGPPSA